MLLRTSQVESSSTSTFSFDIAGMSVSVSCNDASLIEELSTRYRDFACSSPAQLRVHVELSGLHRTSTYIDAESCFEDGILHFTTAGYEGFIDVEMGIGRLSLSSDRPAEDVEYLLRVTYALLAFDAGSILFHAAGIIRETQASVFFGHSGSGKTTIARLCCDDVILNDDLVLLNPHGSKWLAYATPFWTPSQVVPTGRNKARLSGIFRLVQDQHVYLEEMGRGQALAELISNIPVIPEDPTRVERLLEIVGYLQNTVPCYRLHFVPDNSFWKAIDSLQ